MAKNSLPRVADAVGSATKLGDTWNVGPLFPGLSKEPLIAKITDKKIGWALVEVTYFGTLVETLEVAQLHNSVSVTAKEA